MSDNIFKLFLHVKDEHSSWSEEGDKAKDIMYEGEVQDGAQMGSASLYIPREITMKESFLVELKTEMGSTHSQMEHTMREN